MAGAWGAGGDSGGSSGVWGQDRRRGAGSLHLVPGGSGGCRASGARSAWDFGSPVCAAGCLTTVIPGEWLVAIFDAIDPVTASDWLLPFRFNLADNASLGVRPVYLSMTLHPASGAWFAFCRDPEPPPLLRSFHLVALLAAALLDIIGCFDFAVRGIDTIPRYGSQCSAARCVISIRCTPASTVLVVLASSKSLGLRKSDQLKPRQLRRQLSFEQQRRIRARRQLQDDVRCPTKLFRRR